MSRESRNCIGCKQTFAVEPEDFEFYAKHDVPAPADCPDCRQKQRIIFRNFKTLYKRNSDLSGKSMVTMYSPESPYVVYAVEEWWSDAWDAKKYARDFDFNRTFFEQFNELTHLVPRLGILNAKCDNSIYSNAAWTSKNCYFVFGSIDNEDCAYGHVVWNCKDSYDNLYIFKSELCYECVDCLGSNKCIYSQECENCVECIGCFDCRGCTDCIGCVGLNQKSYCIFNKQVSKEEYAKFLASHPVSSRDTVSLVLNEQQKLRRTVPQRNFFGYRTENVSGNHVYNARNIVYSFDVKSGEDSKYLFTVRSAKDCQDVSFTGDIENSYFSLTSAGSAYRFSHWCTDCHDIEYSQHCFSSKNLFGCEGLRNSEYCILNKQYSPEDYKQLRTRIIAHMKKTGEWGNFFPKELSPFAYNESTINEYYPLTKEQALAKGYRWQDNIPATTGQETMKSYELPTEPNEYTDALASEILACATCSKNFRLIPREIEFYKNLKLPLP
jgi:hypothetical protein